jgi:hypothetical protein
MNTTTVVVEKTSVTDLVTTLAIAYIAVACLISLLCLLVYVWKVGLPTSYSRPVTPEPIRSITITPPSEESPRVPYSPRSHFSPSRSSRTDVTNTIFVRSILVANPLMSLTHSSLDLPEAYHRDLRRETL